MSEAELYAARCFEAESALASLQVTVVAAKRRELLKQLDPEGKLDELDNKIRDLAGRASHRKSEFERIMGTVSKRIGVPTAEFSWDDETGEIKIVGE